MRRSLAVVLAVLALFATTGSTCKSKGVKPAPGPSCADPATERRVCIKAHSSNPYQVLVHAVNLDNLSDYQDWDEPVAGGEYEQTLDYTSGYRIRITLEVKGKRGDNITCAIIDGEFNAQFYNSAGNWRCQLELITLR